MSTASGPFPGPAPEADEISGHTAFTDAPIPAGPTITLLRA